jgi:predicted RNA-binding Zn ribbon-like protein
MTEPASFRSGNGAVWLDLLSSLAGRYRSVLVDDLASPEALHAWLAANDLAPTAPVTADDVAATQRTREALHRTAKATIRGVEPAASDVDLLAEALSYDVPVRLGRTGGRLALQRPATAREALARIVREAVTMLAGPERDQLRFCGDDTCSGIFVDRTGRRRWCTDSSCGNRVRVRAYRTRH